MRAPQYDFKGPKDERLHGTGWQTMLEIWGAFGNIAMGGPNLERLAQDAVESIPSGSIYFGGTDPGRCVITALQKSHVNGEPFFTLTQNALADGTYLEYVQAMYGAKVYAATTNDSAEAFQEYLKEAQRRLNDRKLKPGEDVKEVDGRIQVSGQVAVMAINARIAKTIFDKNPDREFYVEESFPLDWMFPHLSPNGPIMRINRSPLSELSDDLIQQDREYWTRFVHSTVGDWLNYDTPVKTITAFVEQTYSKAPPADIYFHEDTWQRWAAKLRASIAGVYAWRVGTSTGVPTPDEYLAKSDAERQDLIKEADFAYRQAFALCPYSPESVYRYVNFLSTQNRHSDALLIAETASRMDPQNVQFRHLVTNYLAHAKDYKVDDEVKLRMIVLNKPVSGDATQVRKRAEEIIAKIKAGAAFAEMASAYSEGRQGREGGDWGWVQKFDRGGALVLRKELADVAFSLKPGELSSVIETPEAIYLMLVEDKRHTSKR